MGNLINFSNEMEYWIFEFAVGGLLLLEAIIMIFTYQGKVKEAKKREDKGSLFLVLIGWIGCFYISMEFRASAAPIWIKALVLPHVFYYIGIVLIVLGIVVRGLAVWTLKSAFTHSVQTTSKQSLIQSGLYQYVRNPAYTGSIMSLMGMAIAYRNVLAPVCVFVLCMICYGIRIRVEERAMRKRFQEEFSIYCEKTKFRLIPYLY